MNDSEKRYIREILESQIGDLKDRFDRYENTNSRLFDSFSRKLDKVCSDTDKNSTHIKLQYGLMFSILTTIIGAVIWIIRARLT